MKREDPTQDILKTLIHYDPETGVFVWRRFPGRKVRIFDAAGTTTDNGYRSIVVLRKPYKAHRLAWLYMTGMWPVNDLDHINHKRTDNRWVNLRECTRTQNLRNALKRVGTSSKYKGVSWYSSRERWEAYIDINGKRKKLGYFDSEQEAATAYDDEALSAFGEFACLNKQPL